MESNPIDKVAREKFFWQTEMIQFLLAENLALKSLLHEKGLLTPDEFAEHKKRAELVLKAKIDQHVEAWKKANPEAIRLFEESLKKAEVVTQGPEVLEKLLPRREGVQPAASPH
jgi:hypothetical protein